MPTRVVKLARADGLTEELVHDLLHDGTRLSPRGKAALEYADLFKSGDEALDPGLLEKA